MNIEEASENQLEKKSDEIENFQQSQGELGK